MTKKKWRMSTTKSSSSKREFQLQKEGRTILS